MSKTLTKIIAGLGVVAGLGVAALPISSYAADVNVEVKINPTIGSVAPDCSSNTATVTGAPNTVLDATCGIAGAANTAISVSIKDADAANDLEHTDGTTVIPSIAKNADLATFDLTSLSTYTSGAWGYNFSAGTTTGLTASSANWNGVPTDTATVVATSSGPVSMTGAGFTFRAITPIDKLAGTYSDTVTITFTTIP